jgi:murein DD-endopeptidase MepM/ murein hydrolase activator NlpD
MIRNTVFAFVGLFALSACMSGAGPAPVVYRSPGSGSATPVQKAPTPATLPPPAQSVPVSQTPVETTNLSEADELDMLDVDPGDASADVADTVGGAPAIVATSGSAEGLSEADELDMLDVDPRGPAPVDLRPQVQEQPSPQVTATQVQPITPQTPTGYVEQQIVPTRDRPGSIKVKTGDTLFSLSEKYQIALQPLIELNGLKSPYYLNKGQTLKLPAPLHYRVQKGDTLYAIARRYKIDFTSLAGINGIEEPFLISPNSILVLPALSRDAQGKWESATPKPVKAKPKPGKPAPKPAPKPKVKRPAATSTFVWPLQGKILSRYGGKAGGMRNDGINIAATANQEIHAAGAGTVIYSGSELKNYGRLILIRHSNGWVTAYAHNAEAKVREGAKVTAGQVIALAGSSGSVDTPQLHFETRKGVKPVDPMGHLPAQ